MNPADALAEFAALIVQRDTATEFKERDRIAADYSAEVRRLWDMGHPRTKRAFDLYRAETWLGERLESVQEPFRVLAKAAAEAAETKRDAITERLIALAPHVELTPTPGAVGVYADSDRARFGTQGNPDGYAKGFAEVMAEEVRRAGVAPTVETTEYGYRVTVPLDHVRVEALKHRRGLGTRDILKMCWKNGINPRVLMPFPHGLEEKMGLDYFGNDVAPG